MVARAVARRDTMNRMASIFVECEVLYESGPGGRRMPFRITIKRVRTVQHCRLEPGPTFVVEDESPEERWPRDLHWCVFPATCTHCGGALEATTPPRLTREGSDGGMPRLLACCRTCTLESEVVARESTLPI
jgi:hypothetical protein